MSSIIYKLAFLGCLVCSGCATLVPDFVKSAAQIKLDNATAQLTASQAEQKTQAAKLARASVPKSDTPITEAQYRRLFLDERKQYVATLVEEYNQLEAKLEKKARNAGYFALSTKAVGIASGVAAAILVAASPANAATVAGLSALTTGTIAFQDTASDIGYSTLITLGQIEALKTAVNTAYLKFKTVPWEYLYSYAGHANQADWDKEMKGLGGAIVQFEAAVRYTKYEVKVTATSP